MPLAETLTVALGGAVVRAVVKQWVGDASLLAEVTDDASQLLGKAGLDFFERRRVARELEEVSERIAERLTPFFEAEEFGGLDSGERQAVAHAVAATVERGFTDASVALSADLDGDLLEKRLRSLSPNAGRSERLGELGTRLYDIALAETCAYLVAMVENLPRFAGAAFSELLARDRAILEKLDDALAHLPRTSAEQALSFETRYAREVARQLDQVRLFGFTASAEARRYQLSVAYISLSVAVESGESDDFADVDDIEDGVIDDFTDEDGGDIVDESRDETDDEEGQEREPRRVEEVVGAAPRLLIRGDAGSGKTTLLSWLAVSAARRSFEGALRNLKDLIPFFVPLRRYAHEELPTPDAFLDGIASAIKGLMPTSFVEDVLDAGRALVLVDGVDELPPQRREEAQDWLDNLTTNFPASRWVVTSRPPAVGEDWLEGLDFDSCTLEPMSLADVDSFIDHWHEAIEPGVDTAEKEALRAEARQLKSTIRRQAPLRRLATSPLLCAMLCALHHDGSAQLPRDRIQLYERALDALLERRDADRRVAVGDGLGLRQKQEVLRELAYWFLRNGHTIAPRSEVVEQIGRTLRSIRVDLDVDEVFEGLLERTGLLRSPALDQVDFIHRTFLEYLAAQAIVEHDDLGYLTDHAHSDTFNEVVVLAAGVANAIQRERLISRLLERADETEPERGRLQLLAVASLETVTSLDDELRRRVEAVLGQLVPPQNLTAANELASAGELAVPLLAPRLRPPLRANEARACVRTLGVIGTDQSLDQLARYGTDDRVTVVRELVRQWNNFDTIEYARRVMADSPLFRGHLGVEDQDGLAAVPFLNNLRSLSVHANDGAMQVSVIAGSRTVQDLRFFDVPHLVSLRELVPLPALTRLSVFGPALQSLDGIQELPTVTSLTAARCRGLGSLDPVSGHPNLSSLRVDGPSNLSLAPLVGLPLERLAIGVGYLDHQEVLSELPRLDSVELSDVEGDLELFPLVDADRLARLSLTNCEGYVTAAPLGRAGRPLAFISIVDCPSLIGQVSTFGRVDELRLEVNDIDELEDLISLGSSIVALTALRGATLPALPPAERLELRLPELVEVPARSFESVSTLLLDCPRLRDLSQLRAAPTLRRLSLVSLADDADLSPLASLPKGCVVRTTPSVFTRLRSEGISIPYYLSSVTAMLRSP